MTHAAPSSHDASERHDHAHDSVPVAPPGYYERVETALQELLIEKGLISASEIHRHLDVLASRTPALGAKVVARAWVDAAFRDRLLADGRKACEEQFGIAAYDDVELIVVANTEKLHNLLVCTLCSCYPRHVLGLPPEWYKLAPYRSRAVVEPRALLREFGTEIPEDVEVRVHDSTAMVRYMVLPLRPVGTEHFSEEALAALVTRDAMIGVVRVTLPQQALS